MYLLAFSALLSASAGVSLSAFKSHAGMKVRAQLRTSTALEGHLEASGTKLLDVAFGVPQSKLELIEFKYNKKKHFLFQIQFEDFNSFSYHPKDRHNFKAQVVPLLFPDQKSCS